MLAPGLFAMTLERPPLRPEDVPGMFANWLQDAGGLAVFGLAIWLGVTWLRRRATLLHSGRPLWFQATFALCCLVAFGSYAINGWQNASGVKPTTRADSALGANPFLTIGGGAALLAVVLPFVLGLFDLRWRRIAALASLSWREAIRMKVLYIYAVALALLLPFADWFLPHKPENQLQTYVEVMYLAMSPLLLLPAIVLAAFGIPRDLRQQTIYTIVTKPVERFEIFLGRFLGYTVLMTQVLFAMTAVSLLYVLAHGINPNAVLQTYRARIPIYGTLDFRGRSPETTGVKMREWGYRRYIPGGADTPDRALPRAVWQFAELPQGLDQRATIPCEFKFDIVRTSKGERDKGIFCTLTFQTWRWQTNQKVNFDRALTQRGGPRDEVLARLANEFGYCEFPAKEVYDQITFAVDVPAGLFQNAAEGYDQLKQEYEQRGLKPPPPVTVTVKCDTPSQFLGMAQHDLYFVNDEGSFNRNFFKGALGIWFRLCLVIGVAVALSTYLSGVVSLIATLFLYGAGLLRDYIETVASNQSEGGGPAEAIYRLANRMTLMEPLKESPVKDSAGLLDDTFRWTLRQLMTLFPDVDRFDLTSYVSEGFNISGTTLALDLLQLVGYLLPWFVLGYYTLRSREVAS